MCVCVFFFASSFLIFLFPSLVFFSTPLSLRHVSLPFLRSVCRFGSPLFAFLLACFRIFRYVAWIVFYRVIISNPGRNQRGRRKRKDKRREWKQSNIVGREREKEKEEKIKLVRWQRTKTASFILIFWGKLIKLRKKMGPTAGEVLERRKEGERGREARVSESSAETPPTIYRKMEA